MSANQAETERNPNTVKSWEDKCKQECVSGIGIAQLGEEYLKAPSQATERQFLTLRTLWTSKKAKEFQKRVSRWIPSQHITTAKEYLATKSYWQEYLKALNGFHTVIPENSDEMLGPFDTVLDEQLLINKGAPLDAAEGEGDLGDQPKSRSYDFRDRTAIQYKAESEEDSQESSKDTEQISNPGSSLLSSRSDMSSTPINEDNCERVVNNALYWFLKTVALRCKEAAEWRSNDVKFIFEGRYSGRCDGFLFCPLDSSRKGRIGATLEVKRQAREKHQQKIQWQETCEKAAEIKHYPNDELNWEKGAGRFVKRRFLIAQDHVEAYIIIAEYTDEYKNYLNGQDSNPKKASQFLNMHQFGPFPMLEKDSCREFGIFTLAIAIFLKAEAQNSSSSQASSSVLSIGGPNSDDIQMDLDKDDYLSEDDEDDSNTGEGHGT